MLSSNTHKKTYPRKIDKRLGFCHRDEKAEEQGGNGLVFVNYDESTYVGYLIQIHPNKRRPVVQFNLYLGIFIGPYLSQGN